MENARDIAIRRLDEELAILGPHIEDPEKLAALALLRAAGAPYDTAVPADVTDRFPPIEWGWSYQWRRVSGSPWPLKESAIKRLLDNLDR